MGRIFSLSELRRTSKFLKIYPLKCGQHRYYATSQHSEEKAVDWNSAKPYSEIPGFAMWPVIGTAWIYMPIIGKYKMSKIVEATKDKKKRFGDVFRERIGSFKMVGSFNAEDMETIIKNEGKYPSRGEITSLKAYREKRKDLFKSGGLLVMNGIEWHDLRQKVQKHMLVPRAIEAYLVPTQQVSREFVTSMRDMRDNNNEIKEFLPELYKWALESIAYVGLDTRLGCLGRDVDPNSDGMRLIGSVLGQFKGMFELEEMTGNMPFWKYFPTPAWRRFEKHSDVFSEVALKYIHRALEEMKSLPDKTTDLTILQALLLREGMKPEDAVVFLSDLLIAGVETTSNTMAFLLYHLSRNPEKQELLHEEIQRILPGKDDTITRELYADFRYLRACLKESMRINPIVGGALRILAKDSVISGYQVPAGTSVVVSFEDVHKDERYFKEPLKFRPERWLNKDEKIYPYAYVPFGFGVRSCVGRRIAELELISLIVELVRKFRVEYHYEDIGVTTRFVTTPDRPLRFNFIER